MEGEISGSGGFPLSMLSEDGGAAGRFDNDIEESSISGNSRNLKSFGRRERIRAARRLFSVCDSSSQNNAAAI